jgi:hypothetical protein
VSTLPDNFIKANSCYTIGVDNRFNLYESDGSTVGKIDSFGNLTVLSAAGTFGYVSEIRLDAAGNLYLADPPSGLAIDNSGNIIVADAGNNKIRKISPQ